ncbi:hypothetical protein F2Q70_00002817 [Brassica cretica]|uniref:Uncharacterized protein n=1 Tax=Brassica cretica TaxID=69181 RepID=A0A8S9IX87_BRACR|nr:hypothetical protein F2Q70_00002817 [Brassica cretica]
MLSLSPDETRLTSIDSFTPAPIDILLILLIDIKHQRAGISFYLINNEPKLISNLNELNMLVLGLGIHLIGFLLQVWKRGMTGELDDLLDPTLPFGELDVSFGPTRRTSELDGVFYPNSPFDELDGDIRELSEDSPEPMQVDQATVGRTLRKRKKKVPKHLKRGVNDKEMDSFTKRILRIPMDNPFDEDTLPTSCGYYYCDHEAEVELVAEASIDTQPEASIDEKFVVMIDEELQAAIDNDHANEIDDLPEGSINSWENNYCQPSFAICWG